MGIMTSLFRPLGAHNWAIVFMFATVGHRVDAYAQAQNERDVRQFVTSKKKSNPFTDEFHLKELD